MSSSSTSSKSSSTSSIVQNKVINPNEYITLETRFNNQNLKKALNSPKRTKHSANNNSNANVNNKQTMRTPNTSTSTNIPSLSINVDPNEKLRIHSFMEIQTKSVIQVKHVFKITETVKHVKSCYFKNEKRDTLVIHLNHDTYGSKSYNNLISNISKVIEVNIDDIYVKMIPETERYILKSVVSSSDADVKQVITTQLKEIDVKNIYVKMIGKIKSNFDNEIKKKYTVFFNGNKMRNSSVPIATKRLILNEKSMFTLSSLQVADNSHFQHKYVIKQIDYKMSDAFLLSKMKGIDIKSSYRPKNGKTLIPGNYMIVTLGDRESKKKLKDIVYEMNLSMEKYDPGKKKFETKVFDTLKKHENSFNEMRNQMKNVSKIMNSIADNIPNIQNQKKNDNMTTPIKKRKGKQVKRKKVQFRSPQSDSSVENGKALRKKLRISKKKSNVVSDDHVYETTASIPLPSSFSDRNDSGSKVIEKDSNNDNEEEEDDDSFQIEYVDEDNSSNDINQ